LKNPCSFLADIGEKKLKYFCSITSVWYFINSLFWLLNISHTLYVLSFVVSGLDSLAIPDLGPVFSFLGAIFGTLFMWFIVLRLHYIIPCVIASRVTKTIISGCSKRKCEENTVSIYEKRLLFVSVTILVIKWVPLFALPISLLVPDYSYYINFAIKMIIHLMDCVLLVIMLFLRIADSIHRKKQQQKEQSS